MSLLNNQMSMMTLQSHGTMAPQGGTLAPSQHVNPNKASSGLFNMTDPSADFGESLTRFPPLKPKRDVVSGKGLDDVYTKNNEALLHLIDENKRTQTENNQLKVVNEKLNDRIDFL